MGVEQRNGYYEWDYTTERIGSVAGDKRVIACPKCGKSGIQWNGTRQVAHVVTYRRETSGKERVERKQACKSALPKDKPEHRQTGLPWCPKEWL